MPEDLCTCGHPKDDHVDLVFGCKAMAPYGDLDDVCCRCSRFAPGQNPADEVRRLRARVADREHELIRARAERDAALAALASIEWQPRRTLAGTEALFCPACLRPKDEPPQLRALNRQHGGIRDDGHRRDCPLASALAETRGRTP